jgi:L-2-hydroxyglutarate oxidase LhgO
MSERIDCAVIGAGVVGLAVARRLAMAGREVILLEAEATIGSGTSSRNSEVIHAGIYYAAGTRKAQWCVSGRHMLYDYCAQHGVEHRRIGKLIVATAPEEVATLAKYEAQARANGVTDLRWLSDAEIAQYEPEVSCVAALLSPSTGIIDSHGLMLAFLSDLEAHGGVLALRSPVLGGRLHADGVELEVGAGEPMHLHAASVVNCAGLQAQQISLSLRGMPAAAVPPCYLAKGHYFSLSGRAPFRHLVYPVANAAGLGTHVTLDLAGQARFGPDVLWIDNIDYAFDDSRRSQFATAIRRYWPGIEEARLQPAYTGIRPKITGEGQGAGDFCVRSPTEHGHCPYVALYGIESPGLTASLAIAEHVALLLA